MSDSSTPARLSSRAVIAFVLGLLALPLNLFAALPAIVVGYVSLRRINESDGRLKGRRLSIIGLLLGVFVCIVDVLGLAATGIFLVRVKSARANCEYHLAQIGKTVAMYYDEHGNYPLGTIANAELPPNERLSWIASLLPYYADLDAMGRRITKEQSIYYPLNQRIDRTKAWDDAIHREATEQVLRAFLCPAHPRSNDEAPPGPTHYIGIAGLGADAPTMPLSNLASGFFGYDRTITQDDVTAGISFTMMTAETAWKNGPWAQGGYATVRGLDPVEQPYTGRDRPFGGLHPGIVNILYVDGHFRAFREDAPPEQFAALATLKRGTQ